MRFVAFLFNDNYLFLLTIIFLFASCNGVAKLGVTSSGHLGALRSPTSSSSSMSPSQDPYTFLDTPSQSPSCIYSPLKLSNSGEQFKNGHLRLTNGDIDNKYNKPFSNIVSNFQDVTKGNNFDKNNTSVVYPIIKTNSAEQLVNQINQSGNFSDIDIKVEQTDDYEVLKKSIKSEIDSDVKYLNKSYNKPSVHENVISFTSPKKLPSGEILISSFFELQYK